MWRAIMHTEETRRNLLQSNSSIDVFVKVVKQVFVIEGQLRDIKSERGHDFVDAVVPSLSKTIQHLYIQIRKGTEQ